MARAARLELLPGKRSSNDTAAGDSTLADRVAALEKAQTVAAQERAEMLRLLSSVVRDLGRVKLPGFDDRQPGRAESRPLRLTRDGQVEYHPGTGMDWCRVTDLAVFSPDERARIAMLKASARPKTT